MDTMKQTTDKGGVTVAGNNRRGSEMIKKIEQVTSGIPSATWLVLGGGAIVGAIVLKAMGRDASANFVGQWVPMVLMLGLYNKMAKLSDRAPNPDRIS
jgi:hypothetical protein